MKKRTGEYVRTNIMLSEQVKQRGQSRANDTFGGNFSAYIAYLILKDSEAIEKPLTLADIQPMQFDVFEGDILKRKSAKKTTPTA